jgi:hypothetical protein
MTYMTRVGRVSATILTVALALTLAAAALTATPIASGAGPGKHCEISATLTESSIYLLTLAHEEKWDTDSWDPRPPREITLGGEWTSVGGFGRGCHNDVRYSWHRYFDGHNFSGTVLFGETYHHHGEAHWVCHHTGDDPRCKVVVAGKRGSDTLVVHFRLQGPEVCLRRYGCEGVRS